VALWADAVKPAPGVAQTGVILRRTCPISSRKRLDHIACGSFRRFASNDGAHPAVCPRPLAGPACSSSATHGAVSSSAAMASRVGTGLFSPPYVPQAKGGQPDAPWPASGTVGPRIHPECARALWVKKPGGSSCWPLQSTNVSRTSAAPSTSPEQRRSLTHARLASVRAVDSGARIQLAPPRQSGLFQYRMGRDAPLADRKPRLSPRPETRPGRTPDSRHVSRPAQHKSRTIRQDRFARAVSPGRNVQTRLKRKAPSRSIDQHIRISRPRSMVTIRWGRKRAPWSDPSPLIVWGKSRSASCPQGSFISSLDRSTTL